MPITFNSAMPLFIMRKMDMAQSGINQSMQRLSSGLRINSAADDAAGLAIATGMTSDVRGYRQSIRNANDGISMLQVAEGTLDEVTNVIQRMRELAIQAANGTLSLSNRKAIQQEIDLLADGVEQMLGNTQFNGKDLFSGNNNSVSIHIGVRANQNLEIPIGRFSYDTLGLNSGLPSGDFLSGRVSTAVTTNNAIVINGFELSSVTGNAQQKAILLNNQLASNGVTVIASNQVVGAEGSGVTDGTLQINGDTVAASGDINQLVDNINRDVSGVIAKLVDGKLILSNDTGATITIANNGNDVATGLTDDVYQGYLSSADDSAINVNLNDVGGVADLDALGLAITENAGFLQSQAVSGTALTQSDGITINGIALDVSGAPTTAQEIALSINQTSEQTGVMASADTKLVLTNIDFTQKPGAANDIRINGIDIDLSSVTTFDEMMNHINTALSSSGVVASAKVSGELVLSSNTGQDIIIEQDSGDRLGTGAGTIEHGKISLESAQAIKITSTAPKQADKEAALAKMGISDIGGISQSNNTGLSIDTV